MATDKLRTEIRKEQIAQAALGIVTTHGLKALSIARVARRVGLVPSALYRHFKSKDEVLDAVIDLIGDRLLANVQIVTEEVTDPIERLRRLLHRHVQLIREDHGVPRVVFSEDAYHGHPERQARVYGMITRYLSRVSDIIRQGQTQGRIRADVDAATVSLMFLGLIQPAAILWHMSNGELDVTRHIERAWRVFSEALIAPRP